MNIENFCLCKPSININSSLGLPVTEDCRALNLLSQRLPQIRAFLQERDQSVLEIVLEVHTHKIHANEMHAHGTHAREMHAYDARPLGTCPLGTRL